MFNRFNTVEANPVLLDELASFFDRLGTKHFATIEWVRPGTHWAFSSFSIFIVLWVEILIVLLSTSDCQRGELARSR